ncbi:MAG: phosphopantetheine-binding protein [Bacteroidota bacterium]
MEDNKTIGAEDSLKHYLQEKIPQYMVPAHFVPIDSVPLNSNGKIDKKSLPDVEIESTSEHQEASTEQEKLLAGIWADLLELDSEKIGVHANFFELGGNSIKIIALHKLIKQHFAHEIKVQDLFDNQTISKCLEVINRETGQLKDEDSEELTLFDF